MEKGRGEGRKARCRAWLLIIPSCALPTPKIVGGFCRTLYSFNSYVKCTNTHQSMCVCVCLSLFSASPSGSVSLSVFLVSVAFVVCAIWLVALCGVCTWCQRKLVSYCAYFSHPPKVISTQPASSVNYNVEAYFCVCDMLIV